MDREKVIKSLKWFRDRDKWREGIMIHDDHAEVRKQICDNAIELLKEQDEEIENLKQTAQSMMEGVCLLKEQEAVKPLPQNSNGWVRTIKLWYCGSCHSKISRRTSKYCPNCGKPILWEGR